MSIQSRKLELDQRHRDAYEAWGQALDSWADLKHLGASQAEIDDARRRER